MDELERALSQARDHAQLAFEPERGISIRQGVERKRRRRRTRRIAAGTAMAAGAAALALFAFTRAPRPQASFSGAPTQPSAATKSAADIEQTLTLGDGSKIVLSRSLGKDPAGKQARVEIVHESKTRVEVALHRGQARFEVVPSSGRLFRVRAGEVQVEVVGTRFAMDYRAGAVEVKVDRGRVRVVYLGASTMLSAGEHGTFGGAVETEMETPAPGRAPAEAGQSVGAHSRTSVSVGRPSDAREPPEPAQRSGAGPSWRELAEHGDYQEAYAQVQAAGLSAVGEAVQDLLLWADVARLTGHAEAAVAPLERVIREHARDPRAALASQTLGRTLLRDLKQPAAAARAFRRVQELAPKGALAEDALAREIQAWLLAGETKRARRSARSYLQLYPTGRWRGQVQTTTGVK